MKNKKISKGLKRHYFQKKYKKVTNFLKALLITIFLVALTLSVITPIKADAPKDRQSFLPTNPDKAELTVADKIMIIAREEGFEDTEYLLALSYCESRHDPYATNENGGHSLDRGLWQWNKLYHPNISNECAFSIDCSTRKTIEALKAGKHKMWMCDKYI